MAGGHGLVPGQVVRVQLPDAGAMEDVQRAVDWKQG